MRRRIDLPDKVTEKDREYHKKYNQREYVKERKNSRKKNHTPKSRWRVK